ncbi:hypothetical protein TL16_g03351 [Triparma laevis f. inornata]|uniref:Uncharacterized protein n=2 Tax=Triparma laevis TaxID=1534972 RepID=A0A9W7FN77_9STRA|nr:hypothetical protein TL16_g03351 [Triparma laevis f. inornata]GMI15061.1 hypothetical protein TrLO_g4128 [Triparma laevis f. longispina]
MAAKLLLLAVFLLLLTLVPDCSSFSLESPSRTLRRSSLFSSSSSTSSPNLPPDLLPSLRATFLTESLNDQARRSKFTQYCSTSPHPLPQISSAIQSLAVEVQETAWKDIEEKQNEEDWKEGGKEYWKFWTCVDLVVMSRVMVKNNTPNTPEK